jgi:DNA-directed RNA polymerase subunit beta'
MMHMLVNEHDCGTTKGIALDVNEKDVHDRFLQQDFTHGKLHIPAGTLLTTDVVGKIRAAKKDAKIIVRSPLKCETEKGICQKCAGLSSDGQLHDLGTNIGVHSAHAVGERAVQLTLKEFHSGGVGSGGGSKLLNAFGRFEQLMTLPKKIPDEASLAMKSGTIEKVVPTATGVDVYIDGRKHHVGRDGNGMPLHKDLPNAQVITGYQPWQPPVVGARVEAGQLLSDPNRTYLNPHHLYDATGSMEQVQNHLAKEVYGLYQKEGIKRRAVETVIKAMSNLTEIVDPGDHPGVLRGEYRATSSIQKMNQDLAKAGQKLIEHRPVMKGITVMPLEVHEDWMAKLQHQHLRETLMEAAALGQASHIHGTHPVPGIAFGAEFGLTKKDSLKPGHERLKDVPAHHY